MWGSRDPQEVYSGCCDRCEAWVADDCDDLENGLCYDCVEDAQKAFYAEALDRAHDFPEDVSVVQVCNHWRIKIVDLDHVNGCYVFDTAAEAEQAAANLIVNSRKAA
jgi:hypothetical protein